MCDDHQLQSVARSRPTLEEVNLERKAKASKCHSLDFVDLLEADVEKAEVKRSMTAGNERMLEFPIKRKQPDIHSISLGPILTKRFRGLESITR